MKRQSIYVMISSLSMILLFQNCGQQMQFGINGALTKVSVNDSTAGAASIVTDASGSSSSVGSPAGSSSSSSSSTVGEGSSSSSSTSSSSSSSSSTVGASGSSSSGSETDEDSDSAENYICILDGPGKSVAVGIENDTLVEQNAVPKVVCMSQNACENIISKKFKVKSAEVRGYCPQKNPNVIPMSDKDLEALI